MKLRVITFGHKRDELFGDAVAEYKKRIVKPWQLELVDLPTGRKSDAEQALVVMKREMDALSAYGVSTDKLCVLDVLGAALSTEKLSDWLRNVQDSGQGELVFAIGGADGLHPELRQRAAKKLSLSALTMPHRLARLVLVEQLYRAQTILRGEKYHK